MILVDSSVWIEYLRAGHKQLASMLEDGIVTVHPFVIGELACGNLKNRAEVLALLGDLPSVPVATGREALQFIEGSFRKNEFHKLHFVKLVLANQALRVSSVRTRL